MKHIVLSLVVTAHDEGILAHKTMQSILEGAELVEKAGYNYEIIIHIDNGNKETIDYFNRYSNDERFRIVYNNFGDLGTSRNYTVSMAKGEYISFLDGDDLVSDNWFLEALKILKKSKKECIVYPEAVLTFQDDDNHVLTIQKKSGDKKNDCLVLLGAKLWGSVVTAKKSTFKKIPYMHMKDGYCYEDYAFNIQTLEQNIAHLIAPNTVLFYRRSRNSMLARANDNKLVLPAMKMFDLEKIKKTFENTFFTFDEEKQEKIPEKKKTFRDNIAYKKIRSNWFLNYDITPFLRLILVINKRIKKIGKKEQEIDKSDKEQEKKDSIVPSFVLEQWAKINKIEIQLYPKDNDLNNTILYDAKYSINIGKTYANLAHSFTATPDYIFIVPWLIMGGADKVLLNYIKALIAIHPDWHIAVITTLQVENKWASELPSNVDLFELGKMSKHLSEGGIDILLSQLITQLKCKKLHIINSELGYKWVKNHSRLIEKNYKVNVSFFADEHLIEKNGNERIVSYENPCLFDIYSNINNIFTDNKNIINTVVKRNAFDRKKFKVHYQPIEFSIKKRNNNRKKTKKILWAGRIDIVKMPEVVVEISKQLKDIQIDIYGAFANDRFNEKMFDELGGIKYCGEYKSFNEIPTDNYDLFLYTSRNDGIPNVILEATAAGLPIVASNDGGVGEFIINNKTGILINDYLKPEEYVKAINDIYDGKYNLDEIIKNAQELLAERHSMDKFIEVVRNDFR